MNHTQLEIGVPVNHDKINDVETLLAKHFGTDCKSLDSLPFNREVTERNIQCNVSSKEPVCECIHEGDDGSELALVDTV